MRLRKFAIGLAVAAQVGCANARWIWTGNPVFPSLQPKVLSNPASTAVSTTSSRSPLCEDKLQDIRDRVISELAFYSKNFADNLPPINMPIKAPPEVKFLNHSSVIAGEYREKEILLYWNQCWGKEVPRVLHHEIGHDIWANLDESEKEAFKDILLKYSLLVDKQDLSDYDQVFSQVQSFRINIPSEDIGDSYYFNYTKV